MGLLMVVLFCVPFLRSTQVQAASPPSVLSVFINNTAYQFSDVYTVSNPIVPIAGGTKAIYVNGRVFDEDGVGTGYGDGDLNTIELQFYRSNVGANCVVDNNDCYRVYCSVQAYLSDTINYSCFIEISYIIDSTMTGGTHEGEVWNAEVIAKDDAQMVDSTIKETEVNTLLALQIPSTLDFGTLTRVQVTNAATNTHYTLTQQGNDVASVQVSGGDLTCAVNGIVEVDKIEWALTDVGADSPASTPLTTSPVNTNISIGTDDDGSLSTTLYWNITMPDVVNGACTGSTSITALAA